MLIIDPYWIGPLKSREIRLNAPYFLGFRFAAPEQLQHASNSWRKKGGGRMAEILLSGPGERRFSELRQEGRTRETVL